MLLYLYKVKFAFIIVLKTVVGYSPWQKESDIAYTLTTFQVSQSEGNVDT